MRDIGNNIKSFRTARNMTQDELAQKLYVTRQSISNYETGKSKPDVDMLVKIAEVLNTDIHQLIYGPEMPAGKLRIRRLIIGTFLSALFFVLWMVLIPVSREYAQNTYLLGWQYVLVLLIRPLCLLFTGWTAVHLIAMALKWNAPDFHAAKWIRIGVWSLLVFWLVYTICLCTGILIDDYLTINRIGGEWIQQDSGMGWSRQKTELPGWISRINLFWTLVSSKYPGIYLLPGPILWVCGFPSNKSETGC